MERPRGDPSLTPEQVEAYNKERQKQAKARMAVISKRHEHKERENDLEGYLARKRTEQLAWTNRNRDKVHKQAAGVNENQVGKKQVQFVPG